MPVPLAPITLVRLNNRCKPRFHNQGIILSYISRRWGCKAGVGGVTWRTITSLNLKKASKLKTIPSAALSKKKKKYFFCTWTQKEKQKDKAAKACDKTSAVAKLKTSTLIIYKYIFRNIYIIYYTGIDHKRALHKSDFVSGPRIAHLVGGGGVTT